jgi:outer membrane immunogenic protein
VSELVTFPGGATYSAGDSSTRTGWTVGGGLEVAFWSNLTARIEGLYYDMGSETITAAGVLPGGGTTGFTQSSTFNFRGGLVRGALNYKF